MYSWIWRHLPGNTPVRALVSLLLAFGFVFLLFQYVFPWAEPLMPFNDVTVNGSGGSVNPSGSPSPSASASGKASINGAALPGAVVGRLGGPADLPAGIVPRVPTVPGA
jgi:hypothetical protein